MGRPPWATPEQIEFLGSFLPNMDREKEGNGLTQYYQRISLEFLKKWPAEPTNEERLKAASNPKKLQELAEARRTGVSHRLNLHERIGTDYSCQQIHQWFKTQRKQVPKASLDLSGKSNRKHPPYQFHHAFSVRYWRKDPSLRQEAKDLWARRNEQKVIDLLAPFMNVNCYTYLQFHNAIMRWKCSLLTDEQRQEHQAWIEQNLLEKEDEVNRPWRAMLAEGDDESLVENSYIQRCVLHCFSQKCCKLIYILSCIDALPVAIDKVLEQIQQSTGMKVIVLVGGPTPAMKGDITTHL